MSNTIIIEVFGIKDESAGGGCCAGSCGPGECGPAPTMGELYQKLVDFLAVSELKDQVQLAFVDVLADELEGHEAAKQAMEKGMALPLTVINGKVRFYGGLSTKKIYETIKTL
jgi:disulfide oxidoreductase YuzD